MAEKYYAVRAGHEPGVFENPSEAFEQVVDFKGAWVQTFDTLEKAETFVFGRNPNDEKVKRAQDLGTVHAYVDGSFNEETNKYSSGIVYVIDDEKIHEDSHEYTSYKYSESRQIAGEVFGAAHAVQWAIAQSYSTVVVHYDYNGVEYWATGEWKTNKPVSQDYKKLIETLRPYIQIEFKKVKAHSGDQWNDRADELAKNALK